MKKRKLYISIFGLILSVFLFCDFDYAGKNVCYRVYFIIPFESANKLQMEYPEILKKEGLAARFNILLGIDLTGRVDEASVWGGLYPSVHKMIEGAMKKWRFRPVLYEGEPVSSTSFAQIIFLPNEGNVNISAGITKQEYIDSNGKTGSDEIQGLLDAIVDYDRKMVEGALNYICTEKLDETVNIVKRELRGAMGIEDKEKTFQSRHEMWDLTLKRLNKKSYLYDYQLVRMKSKFAEKRMLLGNKRGETATFSYSLQPMIFPHRILSRENRVFYSFRIIGENKIFGKKAICLEVSPKSSNAQYAGRIWVEKAGLRLLRIEFETNILEGFPEIHEECSRHLLKPHYSFSCEYGIEKDGLLYPRKAEAKIEYSGLSYTKKDLKAKVEMLYSNYRFFRVSTQDEIKY
jgi:hypothetical protein